MVKCLVIGYPKVAHSAVQIMEHFTYRNFLSQIAVVQEGKYLLPICDLCSMCIPVGRLIENQNTQRYDRKTHMWRRRKDVAIARRCEEASFRLTGEDEVECIEGVETFKYLGQILDWPDDDWLEVFRNVSKALQVWRRLGKLLRWEGGGSVSVSNVLSGSGAGGVTIWGRYLGFVGGNV